MSSLFVPFAPSLAHVSRCLAVAEAWCTQGHTAMFAVGTERVKMVKKAGFEAHPLPEVPGIERLIAEKILKSIEH